MILKWLLFTLVFPLTLIPCRALATEDFDALAKGKPVSLVANDWCPQHCVEGELKGYVVEIVSGALQAEGIPFEIAFQPWLRALREVQSGRLDGLLTPTVTGFPQFLHHDEAVGFQDYCFYSTRLSKWTYQKNSDVLGQRLAYLDSSGFGALDDYIAANSNRIVTSTFAGENNYPGRIFQFLASGRTDLVIITSDVYEFSLKQKLIPNEFRVAGCLGKEKMVVGLTKANHQRSRMIGKALDRGIRKLRKSGQLRLILEKYGLSDWQSPSL